MSPDAVPPVLHVGLGWFPDQLGGLNRYLRSLVEAQQEAGQNARALVVGPASGPGAQVTAVARHGQPLPWRLVQLARSAPGSVQSSGVVDGHFALHTAAALTRRRVRARPLVVHFQGPWAAESAAVGQGGAVTTVKRVVERAVYRRAAEVVVLSRAFARLVVADYGVAPWRVSVVPPAVDSARFRPGDREATRARFGLDRHAFVVATARRLVPRMGVDTLLDALSELAEDHGHVCLVVAGEGPQRPALERRAAALGLGERVRFLGPVSDSDLVALYRAADVVAVPSLALEGFGLVVLEALACGTPVVASAVGGLPDALDGLAGGLLVPPGDPAALADRLRSAGDGSRPLPNAGACRAHAERFGAARLVARHAEVYRRAVAPPTERRLRVVYVDHCARLSGAELALRRLLSGLSEHVDAHVVLGEQGRLVDRLTADGVAVEVLKLPAAAAGVRRDGSGTGAGALLGAGTAAARLAVRLRRLRPDVVHLNTLKAGLYGGVAARLAGVPAVWHARDLLGPSRSDAAVRSLVPWLAAAVVANSQASLEALCLPAGVPTAVVPSGVAAVSRPVPRRARVERIGVVGRVAPWKGQHVVLGAFARAFPSPSSVELAVVGSPLFGEDAYLAGLEEQATRLGVADRVEFRGFRDDVAAELARLDVLVHASTDPEPFGQVVVEGMRAGLPVVVSDAGGPAEVVDHRRSGLRCPPGDVEAISRALVELAGDGGLRRRLGDAAMVRAGEVERQSDPRRLVALYRACLADPPTAARSTSGAAS